jgi:hypothetical protein
VFENAVLEQHVACHIFTLLTFIFSTTGLVAPEILSLCSTGKIN